MSSTNPSVEEPGEVEIPLPEAPNNNDDDDTNKPSPTNTTTGNIQLLDQQQQQDIQLDFVDHFSLKRPSSSVRFRNKQVRIYDLAHDQLQLEHQLVVVDEHGHDDEETTHKQQQLTLQVTMQRTRGGSLGLVCLRVLYTLAALLMFGFWGVFAVQMVMFQALEIPRHGGHAAGGADPLVLIAALLSIPLLVYSMASLMVLAATFVGDTYNGHPLFAFLLAGDGNPGMRVAVEWFCFVMYFGIPVVTGSVCYFAGVEDAQRIMWIVWYICMNLSFFLFAALTAYHEIKLCWDVTRIVHPEAEGWFAVAKIALLTTLTQRYAGVQSKTFLLKNNAHDESSSFTDPASDGDPAWTWTGLYSRTTRIGCNPCFDVLEEPQRRYSIQELRETIPYVTNKTWSLEKICCKFRNGRNRMVVSGPNALERNQYSSTLACSAVAVVLIVLFVCGLLFDMGQNAVVLVVVAIVILLCCVPFGISSWQLYRSMPDDTDGHNDNEEDAVPQLQAWASYTVAKPKAWYCWTRLVLDVVACFVVPVILKFAAGLPRNAVLFLVVGFISGMRLSFDAG